ncbi:sulfatase-like hydrolase/transferase [Microvirga calopogonii]|uniref:sulfatase-like hydrolase/transferase n=1 Tax=Microvirga calopogonii TaxID=2078013 RepID=UPI00315D0359
MAGSFAAGRRFRTESANLSLQGLDRANSRHAGVADATTTIYGRHLPPPQRFEGEINLNAAQSKPAWPARAVPPQGGPNILLIMTDDVGFGAPSTFGGIIPIPNMDRIAANGLRYTNFHSTALCSPTREKV